MLIIPSADLSLLRTVIQKLHKEITITAINNTILSHTFSRRRTGIAFEGFYVLGTRSFAHVKDDKARLFMMTKGCLFQDGKRVLSIQTRSEQLVWIP